LLASTRGETTAAAGLGGWGGNCDVCLISYFFSNSYIHNNTQNQLNYHTTLIHFGMILYEQWLFCADREDNRIQTYIFAIETQAECLFGMLLAIVFINNPTTPQPITKQKRRQRLLYDYNDFFHWFGQALTGRGFIVRP
jgi:hypothetical protein